MNTASADVTWQSWSEKWGHWSTWRRESRRLDKMESLDDGLRTQRVQSELPSMFFASAENARRDAFSTSSSVLAPRPRTS
jgi:hypothetical protein